jgi:hypothetical protein
MAQSWIDGASADLSPSLSWRIEFVGQVIRSDFD